MSFSASNELPVTAHVSLTQRTQKFMKGKGKKAGGGTDNEPRDILVAEAQGAGSLEESEKQDQADRRVLFFCVRVRVFFTL
jgi:hypothetical protein